MTRTNYLEVARVALCTYDSLLLRVLLTTHLEVAGVALCTYDSLLLRARTTYLEVARVALVQTEVAPQRVAAQLEHAQVLVK